jgi:hypothetical protein
MRAIRLLALAFLCAWPIPVGAEEGSSSPMSPHLPPERGPWFEGWYLRVSDKDGRRSLAVIGCSHMPKGSVRKPRMKLPAYAAVIWNDGRGRTRIIEQSVPLSRMLHDGRPVAEDPSAGEESDFSWEAPGIGTITQDGADLRIGDKVKVKVRLSERIPSSSQVAIVNPFTDALRKAAPLNWYPYSVGSEAEYSLSIAFPDGETVYWSGSGYAYQDKNWGNAFPEAWVWSQGISEGNEARFLISGGKTEMGGVPLTVWFLSLQSPSFSWDATNLLPHVRAETEVDACKGTFRMSIQDPTRRVEVSARADPASFAPVKMPTEKGFRPGALESFSGTVEISAFERDPAGSLSLREKLVETRAFGNAALEIGAGYLCRDGGGS